MSKKVTLDNPLRPEERVLYRDRLRAARYAALADAEAFSEVCFAVEALGMRLHGSESTLNAYEPAVRSLARAAPTLCDLADQFPAHFTGFAALFRMVRKARNDAMHIGAYARHAASAGIELCIGLEEAVMSGPEAPSRVADFMVKAPVSVESWQPVAQARQIMLTHSFSFLPVYVDRWKLISELALAKFLQPPRDRRRALALSIEDAVAQGLTLTATKVLKPTDGVATAFGGRPRAGPTLWLIVERRPGTTKKELVGVLSPFELM